MKILLQIVVKKKCMVNIIGRSNDMLRFNIFRESKCLRDVNLSHFLGNEAMEPATI